jgi:ribosomal protein S18 acetylase RimI-like enzyme
MISIKEIISENDIRNSVSIIQTSFKTVADELNLTYNSCPTHPSFVTFDKLVELSNKKIKFFGLFIDAIQIGFIALESSNDGLFYLEKLAILPEYRHQSYGRKLVEFAINYVKNSKGNKISIGIINDQEVLKNWYKSFGFIEITIKKFNHLPFTVCFMDKKV